MKHVFEINLFLIWSSKLSHICMFCFQRVCLIDSLTLWYALLLGLLNVQMQLLTMTVAQSLMNTSVCLSTVMDAE